MPEFYNSTLLRSSLSGGAPTWNRFNSHHVSLESWDTTKDHISWVLTLGLGFRKLGLPAPRCAALAPCSADALRTTLHATVPCHVVLCSSLHLLGPCSISTLLWCLSPPSSSLLALCLEFFTSHHPVFKIWLLLALLICLCIAPVPCSTPRSLCLRATYILKIVVALV